MLERVGDHQSPQKRQGEHLMDIGSGLRETTAMRANLLTILREARPLHARESFGTHKLEFLHAERENSGV